MADGGVARALCRIDADRHRRDRERGQPPRRQVQAEPEPPGGRPAAHHRRTGAARGCRVARGGTADARARGDILKQMSGVATTLPATRRIIPLPNNGGGLMVLMAFLLAPAFSLP